MASTPTPTIAPRPSCFPTKPSDGPSPTPKAAASPSEPPLENHAGTINLTVCRRLFSDESGQPKPVCHPFCSGDPFATIATLIAIPHTQSLHLNYGSPSNSHVTTYRL